MLSTLPDEYHHLSAEEVVRTLDTHPEKGLSVEEVATRYDLFGKNVVTAARKKSAWERFFQQVRQPLVYILLIAALVTMFLNEWVDAAVILGVVIVNTVVGFIQEGKAEAAIEALAGMLKTESTVIRNGVKKRIDSSGLVPGDIVLLGSGDHVPADIRLIRLRDLQVNESYLTGESVPVQKVLDAVSPDTVLAERFNMVYAGSLVTYGQAAGIVTATGNRTETGRISRLIDEAVEIATPLTKKIAAFSKVLLYIILGMSALTFLIGISRGQEMTDMFLAAVALAVGAIPEGMPAAVTITLAIGVERMARRHAIIRRLPAVETLGSTTVICSDKTGTLTVNQMTVREIFAGGRLFEVTGSGYDPLGEVLLEGEPVGQQGDAALTECLIAGVLCNDSFLVDESGQWEVRGDPTEGALISSASKIGLSEKELESKMPRLDVIPFESAYQYMATLHSGGEGIPGTVYMKGSLEKVLERCTTALGPQGEEFVLDPVWVKGLANSLAQKGLRVLAFARGRLPAGVKLLDHADLARDMVFLGLQAMIDPPRPEAVLAVQECRAAGISVKMITGDHAGTAVAIAGMIGLNGDPGSPQEIRSLTGYDLSAMTQEDIEDRAQDIHVFARANPEQKLQIVRALQSIGHIVAVTGDGVNDAPALKNADIGVAMGLTGTDVAKEAADMVLTDDNFASIEAAVEEGRGVFVNLTKFIAWTLPTNVGEGLVILAAIVFGVALPILPVQILWINMTTAVLLGMTLAFEPKEKDIMVQPPRDPAEPILTSRLIGRMLLVSLVLLAGSYYLFSLELKLGSDIATARTMAVSVFVFGELFYLFNSRSLSRPAFKIPLRSNPLIIAGPVLMVLLQLAYTYVPFMNFLFSSSPIGPEAWLRILGVALGLFLLVELEKVVYNRFLFNKA